ncbi:ABC transporter ATP-binding protein [Microtetraspora niveoalba]|uniref:ABC transporter ATP-binding protein n=1 Tax=Microtetraspora niveoalba TaxID=46175 RepID=UPI000830FAFD|nr:ABC transporter ATP-binding protein [Microtetraspora niveoalba]
MTPLLEIADLHVRIGSSHILQGVGFAVPPTGVTAVLGRNGAGKTTTLKAVLGIVPKTGTVRLDGEDIAGLPTHAIVRRGLGYAPEDRGVFAGLTVTENLRLAERGRGPHRYDLVYEMFPELRQRGAQRAGTLSGGQQQMVAIGRTLLNDNRMLLVDEPTKGLAPKIVTEVADVLERAAREVPILLVEQNLALVRRIADHVVVIEQGAVVHTGEAAGLLSDPDLTRELLGVA